MHYSKLRIQEPEEDSAVFLNNNNTNIGIGIAYRWRYNININIIILKSPIIYFIYFIYNIKTMQNYFLRLKELRRF